MAHDWTLETIDLGRVRYREADALHESTMLKWLPEGNSPQHCSGC